MKFTILWWKVANKQINIENKQYHQTVTSAMEKNKPGKEISERQVGAVLRV